MRGHYGIVHMERTVRGGRKGVRKVYKRRVKVQGKTLRSKLKQLMMDNLRLQTEIDDLLREKQAATDLVKPATIQQMAALNQGK